MQRGRALVLILALFLVVVLVGSIAAVVVLLRGGSGSVEEGSVLVLEIGGSLPEQPAPEEPLPGLGGGGSVSMLEIDSALRKAAVDDRVSSVLVEPKGMGIGYAKAFELRDMLRRFATDSGKPVICWMEAASNREYLVATGCDEIWMAPTGFMLVNGLHFGVTFYKGTLDKLGVKADFARAGKYKSAIEPMTSEQMSPPFRQMLESMADSLFGQYVAAVAQSREALDEVAVRAVIDDPPLTAAGATRAGLIDGLLYRDQLLAKLGGATVEPISAEGPKLGKLVGDDDDSAPSPPALLAAADDDDSAQPGYVAADEDEDEDEEPDLLSFSEYQSVSPSSLGLGKGPKVAVIYCEGQIMSGKSNPGGPLGARTMGSDTIAAALRKARKDDSIKAIVLRVDSPGGSGLASDIIWREVELARRAKPVIAAMSDYAASGGYYISMAADAIVAQPATLTGSIGVFGGKYDLGGLYGKLGMQTEDVKRGELSDLFASDRGLGDAGRRKFGEFIDEFYETFITKAGQGRKLSPLAIHEVAQGRVWTGEQAREIGLVDEVGTFRTALKLAKEKAGIDGEARLVLMPRQATALERLLNRGPAGSLEAMLDRSALGAALPADARADAQRFLSVAPLLASGQPLAMAPYHLVVR